MVHGVGKIGVDFVFLYHPHPYDVDPGAQVGLGMLLLASYAKQLGATVRVINAQSMDVVDAIHNTPICKYLMLYGCLIDIEILKTIVRETSWKVTMATIIGGPITKSPFRSEKAIFIDGFGEDVIEMLVSGKIDGPHDTSHLNYSINHYPFPDRSLIEGGYGGNIFKRGTAKCGVSTTLLTSRGCRYHCAFCSSGGNGFFEEYEIGRIEKELEHCLSIGISNIRVSDDNLVANPKRLASICSLLKEAKIKWRGSIRTSPNNIELYEMMADAGCEELSFGIESGDQHVLNLLNKGATLGQNTEAIWNAKKAGILTRALMMMGTPGETRNTLYLNMGWIEMAKPDMVSLKIFVPYPGTDIYHNPKKYHCKIHLPLAEVNNSSYRPDGSVPQANIDSEELYQEELTWQFLKMKSYLETKGIENRG